MKKILAVAILLSLSLGACLPAALRPQAPAPSPVSASVDNLHATETAAAQSLPSLTPSPTDTSTPGLPTETPDFFLTLGAATAAPQTTDTPDPFLLTLGAATAGLDNGTATPSATATSSYVNTPTNGPMISGTMPPFLPSGNITLTNRSKVEAYISLHCTTFEGYVTYIEYPVASTIKDKIPAGRYAYVLWVGGRQITGNFRLDRNQDLSIIIYADRVVIN